jgi:hypothetical protein
MRSWIAVGALSVGGSIAAGYVLGGRTATEAAKGHAWGGTVAKVVRAGGEAPTLQARGPKGEAITLTPGAKVGAGIELHTDARSRARIELDDGTVLALDRQTTLRFEAGPRTIRVTEGVVMADVAHVTGAPPARMFTPSGEIDVLGTKFALTTTADRTSVEVLRGAVELRDESRQHISVGAGQEGIASRNAKLEIAPVQGLAQRLAFGERLGLAGHNEDTDLPVSGLGELRAKKPGKKDEKDRAVRLAAHRVKVRVAGSVARTEIDEVFTNDADEELEGIYRFPLPPGAQIERLALEVDGKLVDGAFVDKSKGAAIWRGVIQNAAPKAPKPKEEIFWVPGPWRDPALLEWKRGGRFELHIFPIPKRGSRRIVIAYTENLAPVAGVRRYTYPLPQSTSSDLRIGAFDLDLQVLGSDPKQGVRARGYELRRAGGEGGGGGERFTMSERDFVPTGDLTVEYALADRASDVSAWAYSASEPVVPAAPAAGARVLTASTGASAPSGSVGSATQNYAALALRPKFGSWGESNPRDVVLVVDSGRAMFGERFQRARRLAVQVAQELDRRDRVTVLACDVTCRESPGGLVNAGGQNAKTIAEFLGSVEPDGATDLVGALRRAASRRDGQRDLRIVLVTDGVVGAGYRAPERIEREAREFLGDARTSLVAVPIGADADARLLEGVARAGGGVVVPYAPGQTLEGTAIDVLTASYGVSLRDVEVTLPAGMSEMAPRVLPALRPGGELLVTAKLDRDAVKGDVIHRGRVAGQPFEARYPLDVKATSSSGNAFVPRLFAAARIADLEDSARTDAERAEIVKLSQRYSVPSRLTSLLVLESEAMFRAFGIDRDNVATAWTGESLAEGTEVPSIDSVTADLEDTPELGDLAKKDELANGYGSGGGGEVRASGPQGAAARALDRAPASMAAPAAPAPLATTAPAKPKKSAEEAEPKGRDEAAVASARSSALGEQPRERSAPPMRRSATTPSMKAACTCVAGDAHCTCLRGETFMKRIWVRHAAIAQGATAPISAARITAARAALQSAPDERNKHRDFARLLSQNGEFDELGEVLARWSGRDPMDADVIAMRADQAARSGDRARALRVLAGVAASGQADVSVLEALAQSNERAGETEGACAFRVSVAEARTLSAKGVLGALDNERVARAVACEERAGHASRAGRGWFDGVKEPSLLDRALAKVRGEAPREALRGDVIVTASWDAASAADVDVAIVDASGQRLSWVTRSNSVRVQDPTSHSREVLAVSTTGSGPFTVELTRASGASPVRVQLSIRALGERSSFPVVLSGPVSRVARVQVRVDQEFVAVREPPSGPVVDWRR